MWPTNCCGLVIVIRRLLKMVFKEVHVVMWRVYPDEINLLVVL
jgi:hypothetical protein